jgi:hypothetical protein
MSIKWHEVTALRMGTPQRGGSKRREGDKSSYSFGYWHHSLGIVAVGTSRFVYAGWCSLHRTGNRTDSCGHLDGPAFPWAQVIEALEKARQEASRELINLVLATDIRQNALGIGTIKLRVH